MYHPFVTLISASKHPTMQFATMLLLVATGLAALYGFICLKTRFDDWLCFRKFQRKINEQLDAAAENPVRKAEYNPRALRRARAGNEE